MNKNLSLAIHIATILAVVFLYFLHFKGNTSQATSETAPLSNDTTAAPAVYIPDSEIKQSGIVFINTDSLLKNYDFYTTSLKSMEARRKKVEANLTGSYNALQTEAIEFQKKAQAGSLTQEEGARKEQELMMKQQQLMQDKETQMGKLLSEEQKLSEDLNKRVQKYVGKFCKGKNYQYVLGYTSLSSNILFKNDSLDITQPVLKGLNEEYRSKK